MSFLKRDTFENSLKKMSKKIFPERTKIFGGSIKNEWNYKMVFTKEQIKEMDVININRNSFYLLWNSRNISIKRNVIW